MNRKLKTLAPILLAIALLLQFSGCSKKESTIEVKKAELSKLKSQLVELQGKITTLENEIAASGMNGNGSKFVNVNIREVKPETFRRFLDVQGSVQSQSNSSISAKMPGQVVKINVVTGSVVKKGDLMLQIDDDLLQKGLTELENQLDFANTMFEKQKRLWEAKAGSEVQYLQAKNGKEALEKRMQSLKEQISYARIIAPFDGVVDEVVPKVGETVSPGFPVIRLTGMSDIKVVAEISETYMSTVNVGDPVVLKFNDLNKTLDAKISVITKMIDPKNRTFKVEVRLPQILPGLRPNMICGLSINDVTIDNTITAPIAYVQHAGEKKFVFLADESNGWKAKKVYIVTGLSYQDKVQVLDGLKPGEKIITNGSFDVADGQELKVIM